MKVEDKVKEVIEAPLEARGYGLVQVKLLYSGKRQILSIDIERLDEKFVSIDDCTGASRLISTILDVEDFIKGAYNLEVSSPGENRPLTKIRDFERFCGKTAKMELFNSIDGMKKVSGKLGKLNEALDAVILQIGDGLTEISVPLSNIKKASVKVLD